MAFAPFFDTAAQRCWWFNYSLLVHNFFCFYLGCRVGEWLVAKPIKEEKEKGEELQ